MYAGQIRIHMTGSQENHKLVCLSSVGNTCRGVAIGWWRRPQGGLMWPVGWPFPCPLWEILQWGESRVEPFCIRLEVYS